MKRESTQRIEDIMADGSNREGFRIVGWNERYEVNKDNRSYKSEDVKRTRPLEYIRSKCNGHKQSAGYRYMLYLSGNRAAEVFGVFTKLKEFAGMVGADTRDGTIYNEQGEPATIADVAWMSGFTEDSVRFSLDVLSNTRVGWIQRFSAEPADSGDLLQTAAIPARTAEPVRDNRDPLKDVETDEETDEETDSGAGKQVANPGPSQFQEFWNSQKTLTMIREMTKGRRRKLRVRNKEPAFRENWKLIITLLSKSKFHTGDNDRQWKADVDWLLRDDKNYIRILERENDILQQHAQQSPYEFQEPTEDLIRFIEGKK